MCMNMHVRIRYFFLNNAKDLKTISSGEHEFIHSVKTNLLLQFADY